MQKEKEKEMFQHFNFIFSQIFISLFYRLLNVATLALNSRPRQRLAKVWAKYETQESIFMLLGVQESVRDHTVKWAPTLGIGVPNAFPSSLMDSNVSLN